MKALIVSCVMVVAGCKQGDKPPAEHGSGAQPGSGSSSGSAVAIGSGSGSAAGSGAGSGACVITVAIRTGTITYEGGGIAGNVDRKPGEAPNLDVLKRFAGKCSAFVTADPTLQYQDVITVMDTLVKDGIVDVSLGKPGDPPSTDAVKHTDLGSGAIKTIDRVKTTPILIVTKTEVMFQGKEIAKLADPALEQEVSVELPANPKDPALILQADAQTPAGTINRLITVAKDRGYTELLFAVKTK
jgi:biopolymer transport protein ExbD